MAERLRELIPENMNETIQQQILDAKQCMGCMHEGVIVTSSDGTILETSPAAERILEAPSMSLRGRQVRDFCSMPEAYDELIAHAGSGIRNLNKSIIVRAGGSNGKIV